MISSFFLDFFLSSDKIFFWGITMGEKEYKWDISLLNGMKECLQKNASLLEKRYLDIDSSIIDELLFLSGNHRLREPHNLKERFLRVYENRQYLCSQIDENQAFYLKRLEHEFGYVSPICKKGKTDFSIEELLELLQDFIDWLPSKKLAQFLKIYYERDFSTHFFYCQNSKLFPYRGSVYPFNYFISPFIIVTKESFVETFITLAHEMGHVLVYLLDLKRFQSKCSSLFLELDGRYFEEMARLFLREKNLCLEEEKKSTVNSYNDIIKFSKKITTLNLSESFFTYSSVEEKLCEIYSYLGSLELLGKYHGDYEKQLYALLHLLETASDDVDMFLLEAGFHWRENDFKQLRKRRENF